MSKFAVIDLGSNSVRLQISSYDISGKENPKKLLHLKEYVRLSENMGEKKILQPEPIKRTLAALRKFTAIIKQEKVDRIKAVATAAVRQAKKQAEFLEMVKIETGIDFTVIPGKEEAFLDYMGVTRTLMARNCLILDTGGASTELILVNGNEPTELLSLPFGSVTLSQKFSLQDKIETANLFKAMTFAEMQITNIPWLRAAYKFPLVVLGGSNRTIAKIDRRKGKADKTDLAPVHGYKMATDDIFDLMTKLISLSKLEREQIAGLSKARSDVIVGGLIPINIILRVLHIDQVTFSNAGLREGTLFSYLESKNK